MKTEYHKHYSILIGGDSKHDEARVMSAVTSLLDSTFSGTMGTVIQMGDDIIISSVNRIFAMGDEKSRQHASDMIAEAKKAGAWKSDMLVPHPTMTVYDTDALVTGMDSKPDHEEGDTSNNSKDSVAVSGAIDGLKDSSKVSAIWERHAKAKRLYFEPMAGEPRVHKGMTN